ncbi:MAG: GNAT family N-acetyltransferase [Burkholderiales bacterium]
MGAPGRLTLPYDFRVGCMEWEQARNHSCAIRETVFIIEQGVTEDLEWDGLDAEAQHALAYTVAGLAIGTARLLSDGHIGRMAVLKPWRHRGVGTALLDALLELAKRNGLSKVFLNAQEHAVGFYEKHGFRVHGETFMDAGIPHFAMTLDLGIIRSRDARTVER